jgi:hypothetical protein
MGISSVLGHSERLCSSNTEAQECIPILFVCDFLRPVRLTYSDESTAMAQLCFDLGDRSDTTNVTPVFVVHGQHRTAIIDAIIGLELIGIRRAGAGLGGSLALYLYRSMSGFSQLRLSGIDPGDRLPRRFQACDVRQPWLVIAWRRSGGRARPACQVRLP